MAVPTAPPMPAPIAAPFPPWLSPPITAPVPAVLATVLLDERLGALQVLGGVAVIAAALTVDVAEADDCSGFTQLALSGDS